MTAKKPTAKAKPSPRAKTPRKPAAKALAPKLPKPKTKRQPRGGAVATSPERCKALENRTMAMELRINGLKFREIGAAMGISEQRAHQLVTEGLAHSAQVFATTAQELRELETLRLTKLYQMAFQRATVPAPSAPGVRPEMDYEAARLCVRISDRLAKLHGIDSPKQITVQNPDGSALPSQPIIIEIVGVSPSHGDGAQRSGATDTGG